MPTPESADELYVALTTQPYSRLVDLFCREYRPAFARRSERESRSGFRLCLSLNGAAGSAAQARFGPGREHIALLRDRTGAVAAGMNFICFPMYGRAAMTVHTIYVFTAPAWRGRGLLRGVYRATERIARAYGRECGLSDDLSVLFVGEQKDPFRMTLAAFRTAAAAYGPDAFDRLAMWGQLGARVLRFRYVLPPLKPGAPPDATLFLRVLFRDEVDGAQLDAAPRHVEANVLQEHLRRFFGLSVAKGLYDPAARTEVRAQMAQLNAQAAIPAMTIPAPHRLEVWKQTVSAALTSGAHPDDTTLGDIIGIASVQDAVAAEHAAAHSLATYV
jgi:GNAT superfamily N-acetyltransferase